ncbi:hypothetical protein NUM3379_28610 [Kineococcus sp. NUM-3379]
MTTVRWDDFKGSPKVEEFVAVALGRAHPGIQRIDGAGGDEGRDMQYVAEGIREIYEVKSFTGRMSPRSPNRRVQVERSLKKAAELNPTSWTLIVPIDPNPVEDRWFDGLRRQYPFPLEWWGLGWLNDMAATHSDARKYFFEDANAEVVRLLRELKGEDAVVGSIQDAFARTRSLRDKLNEIDPYYRFHVIDGPIEAAQLAHPAAVMYMQEGNDPAVGVLSVAVVEKQTGAAIDRPMTVNLRLNFDQDEVDQRREQELRGALNFGRDVIVASDNVQGVVVDAPAGLGGSYTSATISLGSVATPNSIQAGKIEVRDPDGSTVAALPLVFNKSTRGQHGIELSGADISGVLKVTFRIDSKAKKVEIDFHTVGTRLVTAAQALPALRLAASIKAPNELSIAFEGVDVGDFETLTNEAAPVSSGLVELFTQLRDIQDAANNWFEVTLDLTEADVREIRETHALLRGEVITVAPREVPFQLHPGKTMADVVQGPVAVALPFVREASIAGQVFRLGDCLVDMRPVAIEPNGQDAEGNILAIAKPLDDTVATMCILTREGG